MFQSFGTLLQPVLELFSKPKINLLKGSSVFSWWKAEAEGLFKAFSYEKPIVQWWRILLSIYVYNIFFTTELPNSIMECMDITKLFLKRKFFKKAKV